MLGHCGWFWSFLRIGAGEGRPSLCWVNNVCLCARARSYLTPVRDEESESQRKARSRQARQSRRSTQVSSWRHAC